MTLQEKRKQLIKRLQELQGELVDKEVSHVNADRLLLDFINDEEVTNEYEKIDKWYA